MPTDAAPKRSGASGADRRRTRKSSLPDQRTLLRWLLSARLGLAVLTLVGAALEWTERPGEAYIISIAVLIGLVLTAYAGWRTFIRELEPGRLFLAAQALVDLGVVTTLVHFGGTRSIFPALYVLVIAAYGVLLSSRASVSVAVLATLLYLGAALWDNRGPPDAAFWAQVGIFNIVFVIVAVLARRLREAGAEQATLETELERVRLEADDILYNIRSGVLTVDGLGRLAFVNPTGARLLGLEGEELIGRPILDLLKQRSAELWAAIVAGIRSGRKVSRGEGLVCLDGGRTFPIGLSTTTFQQAAQEAPSVTAIFTDISDLKQLQDLRMRAERLEAVAALSASLAHEIRNPLASIRSSVEQLARVATAGEDEKVLAGLIVRESDRLTRLLSEFLDFSRVRATRAEPVDLYAVASAAVGLVRAHPDCGSNATLVVEGRSTMLEGDEDLLHRVVANLTLNAVQAARGESVRVTVRVALAPVGDVPQGADFEQGVRLVVSDNGPGIPDEIREHLFEPFVSGRTGGTGLGLAIVQRAVEAHRGFVLMDSAPGTGTTFTIFLPATWMAEDAA
jgi:two-component system sensor histidine kinase PilS (NtrC family)